MSEPTPEQVRGFWTHMLSAHGARRFRKSSSVDMRLIATALRLMGIQDREKFLSNYATTLGRRIYIPFEPGVEAGPWSLWAQIVICTHECEHVLQYKKGGVFGYYWPYLTNRARRAMFETKAYRTNLELSHWRWGRTPAAHVLANQMRGYGLSDVDVRVSETALEMSVLSVEQGAVVNRSSRTAIAWLKENAPELRES
jgi:hypothetical protein